MANLTSVGLTSGVPTTGTGTVSTLDAVIAVLPAALAANGGLKVEGVASGVAQPVSLASVPSHAVTNAGTFATQATLGSTQNTNLANIDSATSRLTSSATNVAAGSALATTSLVVGTRYKATPPTFTDGQEGALQIDSAGRLLSNNSGVWDKGVGTGGSLTQRVTVDTSQIPSAGNTTMSASVPVTLANNQTFFANTYKTVAASQTAQVIQTSTGATGDWMSGILVIPNTTSPGNVLLLDNATSITVFTGGATSVSNLVPFLIPIGAVSVSGAWKITTGANVTCIAIGKFS